MLVVDDGDIDVLTEIRRFCNDHHLVGLKTHSDNVMNILRSNVDLGGILLSESYHDTPRGGIALGQAIHALRPELPIFLRRRKKATLDDLPAEEQHAFCAAYTIGELLEERNVSFGSSTPQLCFKYTLNDLADQSEPPVNLYQRFLFNLNWNPDGFEELAASTTEEWVESGELEMF